MKLRTLVVISIVLVAMTAGLFIQHQQISRLTQRLDALSEAPLQGNSDLTRTAQQQVTQPDFSQIVSRVKSSVVSVASGNSVFTGHPDGMGAGFFVSEDGYILTNYHLVEDADEVTVRLIDGQEFTAQVVGNDRETDVALLKIEFQDAKPLKPGNVENLKVGEWLLALGTPFGFEHSVAVGVLSAKRRFVGEQYIPYLQSDLAINQGNSGGPLLNAAGEVVGINTKILSTSGGSIGLSFAIPIDLALDMASQIRQYGEVQRGFLGVGYIAVSSDFAREKGLSHPVGARISRVAPNSPAADIGLQVDDVVLAVNDKQILRHTDLPFYFGRVKPGRTVQLKLWREGRALWLPVVAAQRPQAMQITEAPPQPLLPPAKPDEETTQFDRLGLLVAEMSTQDGKESDRQGVQIKAMTDGKGRDAGLRIGDIILGIMHQPISDLEDYNQRLKQLPPSGVVPIKIYREGDGISYRVLNLQP